MKTPRYTDSHKYPHGYKKAAETNVEATFRREREKLKANAAEAALKVRPLKEAKR